MHLRANNARYQYFSHTLLVFIIWVAGLRIWSHSLFNSYIFESKIAYNPVIFSLWLKIWIKIKVDKEKNGRSFLQKYNNVI